MNKSALCFGLLILASLPAVAKTQIEEINSLASFETSLVNYANQNPGNLLVVFDIDDTLLEANSFVGSDRWYNWQRGREMERTEGGKVTISDGDKYACLFSKLGVLYEIGAYHVTEEDAAIVVSTLQRKFDVMALTSRSPDYRAGTERELQRASISFSGSHLLPESSALAYNFNDGGSTRPVSYQNGVVMSTGLNKGVVLEDLLNRLNKHYASIFFIDDSLKNVQNMQNRWEDKGTMVKIFHYLGVDKRISTKDISQSRESKSQFNAFLASAFPNRYAAFSEGVCD